MGTNRVSWRYTLAILCVFAIGVAVRLLPLYWTPYPFNPDGFVFAAIARDSLALGHVPGPGDHRLMAVNRYVFVLVLVVLSRLTGLVSIGIAQPIISLELKELLRLRTQRWSESGLQLLHGGDPPPVRRSQRTHGRPSAHSCIRLRLNNWTKGRTLTGRLITI